MRVLLGTRISKALLVGLLLAPWTALPALAEPLVVATTTIVGDVVGQVAGDRVEPVVLFPVGADPHSFEPKPQDAKLLTRADVVFAVGAGLEERLEPLLLATEARVVELAPSVPLHRWGEDEDNHHGHHEEDDQGPHDPHVWMDPTNVALWTYVIEEELAELDPAEAEGYATRAAAYREELQQLDRWIERQVYRIPPGRRLLVVDHHVFGYFARRYGFRELGAVIPALSTLAEPAPRELTELAQTVRELGVPAVFISTTVNPALFEAVARDAGANVVRLYTGSLSPSSGPAPTYVDLMRYNVGAIVDALEEE
ncbi:MAG: metal ABC transporter substrate-binding protein [Candidatus Bipolaricaulota bacterium]